MPGEVADFWAGRWSSIGHTGWKDPVVYAYDQIERLAILSAELDSLHTSPLTAIDFGCGTGDFCRLFLEKGFRVWGYDPYVAPEISHPDFTFTSQHADLDVLDGTVGLILSVTVLDHIVDAQEFELELAYLRANASGRGVLLMIEYALDQRSRSSSEYQAYRTIDEWERSLSRAGWRISQIRPIPHPSTSPSDGFRHYRKSIPVWFAERAIRYGFLKSSAPPLLTRWARLVFDQHGIGKVERSPLKLVLCQGS